MIHDIAGMLYGNRRPCEIRVINACDTTAWKRSNSGGNTGDHMTWSRMTMQANGQAYESVPGIALYRQMIAVYWTQTTSLRNRGR